MLKKEEKSDRICTATRRDKEYLKEMSELRQKRPDLFLISSRPKKAVEVVEKNAYRGFINEL